MPVNGLERRIESLLDTLCNRPVGGVGRVVDSRRSRG